MTTLCTLGASMVSSRSQLTDLACEPAFWTLSVPHIASRGPRAAVRGGALCIPARISGSPFIWLLFTAWYFPFFRSGSSPQGFWHFKDNNHCMIFTLTHSPTACPLMTGSWGRACACPHVCVTCTEPKMSLEFWMRAGQYYLSFI